MFFENLILFRISDLVLRICSKALSAARYPLHAINYYTSDRQNVRRNPHFLPKNDNFTPSLRKIVMLSET